MLANKTMIQGNDGQTLHEIVSGTLAIIDEFCDYLNGIQIEYKQYMYELRCIR